MDLITDQQSWRSQGMTDRPLTLVLVSTPIGQLGSGRGGGVELTFTSVLKGLVGRGHAACGGSSGSHLPALDGSVTLHTAPGLDQPSWQHADREAAMQIPLDGVLPQLWDRALRSLPMPMRCSTSATTGCRSGSPPTWPVPSSTW